MKKVELKEFFLDPDSASVSQDEFLESTLALGIQFKRQAKVREGAWNCPAHIEFSSTPLVGLNQEQMLSEFKRIANASTNFSSPNFIGFPDAGNSLGGLGASILIPFLNQNMINQDFCAPEATFVEMETIHWLRELIGYVVPGRYHAALEIGGCSVHGGVLANATALLAARERLFPGTMKSGLKIDPSKVKVLVPAGISHYSIRMSLAWLGLGEHAIVDVATTSDYRMDQNALIETIRTQRALGSEIMACVVYAGDSRTMAVDHFDEIGEILRSNGIWFHVDSCHGVQILFSEKHRHKLKGLNCADSVTVDPHKVLWIPYVCSYVLFKNQSTIRTIASSSDLITKERWSLGQTTPFIGSKAFNSLKLWSVIKNLGVTKIGLMIDERLELSASIQSLVNSHPNLLMLNQSDINSTMFMYCPRQLQGQPVGYLQLQALNEINLRIKNTILESGESYIHGFPIPASSTLGKFPKGATLQVLRIMNGNVWTTLESVELILNRLCEVGSILSDSIQLDTGVKPEIRRTPLFSEFMDWLDNFAAGVEHVGIVYGSSVNHDSPFKSDIDFMIIAEDNFCTLENQQKLIGRVLDLHKKFGLPIDEEVPFETKLLVPMSVANQALNGFGFRAHRSRVEIPEIIKTKEFLGSEEMRARLIVNVLSTHNIMLTGTFDLFYSLRQRAAELIVWILLKNVGSVSNHHELCDLFYEMDGRSGEDFLGYKRLPNVDRHLRPLVKQVFDDLLRKGHLLFYGERFVVSQTYDLHRSSQLAQARTAASIP